MPVIDVIRIFGNANFIGNVVEVHSVYVFQFHSWEAILRIFIIHMQPRMRRIIDTQVIELKVNFHTTNEKKKRASFRNDRTPFEFPPVRRRGDKYKTE